MLFPLAIFAQETVSGTITEASTNNPLPGANVIVKGTTTGAISDFDGKFSLDVDSFPVTIVVSSVGFNSSEVEVTSSQAVTIALEEGVALDEVLLLGNRAKPRTLLDSPVPIDNIGVEQLTTSGQATIENMLTFTVPSFNSQNQAISDATAHYDPADLRGLGPSRTLVLVNGKRKNQSAQVFLNRTPGKGEIGVDLKSIPTAAIERVEVLRDGASAQYGSDAIAGVINMVLKKDVQYSTITAKTGITSQSDGFNFAADFNTAFNFGDGGYANVTLGYYKQKLTNRAGELGIGDLPPDPLPNWVQWATENPDLGMHVGQPDLEKKDLFVNIGHPLGENAELYSFHGYTDRTGRSFAYYRAPYWRQGGVGDSGFITAPEDFQGYQPTFETDIKDHLNALGVKFLIGDTFNVDASLTYGANTVMYTVNNSVNRDYLADNGTSPRTFTPGGYSLRNVIGNLDFSNVFSDVVSMSAGIEWKKEFFEAFEGDPLSYYRGGSDSFAGIKPEEAGEWDRTNFAAYAGLDFDISEDLLIGAAGRFEDFSDVDDTNFSWKVMGRYKLGDNGAIRGSYSTGFRAPTLHQRHLTNSQYIIVAGSSEPLLQGTLANDSQAVQDLGVPSLTYETSKNIAAGITYKFDRHFSASVDFYNIKVEDRVLFSSQIGYTDGAPGAPTNPVETILDNNGVVAVQFFINAGDTKTTGADIVLNYDRVPLGNGLFSASLAANFNKTEIDAISTPSDLSANGYDIFAREEQGLITNSRPKSKFILGLNYDGDKVTYGLNNTMFGKVTITAPAGSGGTDQELSSKIATDIFFAYKLTERLKLKANLNNIFDVYPDVTEASTMTSQAGNRFVYSSEVQQLGQLGANFSIGLDYKF
jgi:iron complex outermembrane receptor protein